MYKGEKLKALSRGFDIMIAQKVSLGASEIVQ